jgi:hypothetical protein
MKSAKNNIKKFNTALGIDIIALLEQHNIKYQFQVSDNPYEYTFYDKYSDNKYFGKVFMYDIKLSMDTIVVTSICLYKDSIILTNKYSRAEFKLEDREIAIKILTNSIEKTRQMRELASQYRQLESELNGICTSISNHTNSLGEWIELAQTNLYEFIELLSDNTNPVYMEEWLNYYRQNTDYQQKIREQLDVIAVKLYERARITGPFWAQFGQYILSQLDISKVTCKSVCKFTAHSRLEYESYHDFCKFTQKWIAARCKILSVPNFVKLIGTLDDDHFNGEVDAEIKAYYIKHLDKIWPHFVLYKSLWSTFKYVIGETAVNVSFHMDLDFYMKFAKIYTTEDLELALNISNSHMLHQTYEAGII